VRRPGANLVVLLLLLAAAVGVGVGVVPDMRAEGSISQVLVLDLGDGGSTPNQETTGDIDENAYGFVVGGRSSATVEFQLRLRQPDSASRAYLRIAAYGSADTHTTVSLVSPSGGRELFTTRSREEHVVDITDDLGDGPLRLEARAENDSPVAALFLDRVIQANGSEGATPSASRWLVALWMMISVAAVLQAARWRLRRHWPLVALSGVAVWLFWGRIGDTALDPLSGRAQLLWDAATQAKTFDLHTGLLSGSFGDLSPLAVQLFHALTPITGTAPPGARTASAIAAVAALGAIYAVAHRVAGRTAAVAAVALALVSDPFRAAATSGEAATTLVLAGAILLLAIHVALARTGTYEALALGLAGGLAVLAYPSWLPGLAIGLCLLIAVRGEPGRRLRTMGSALGVLVLVTLLNRISAADQAGGSLFADIGDRFDAAAHTGFIGGALAGAYDSLDAAATQPDTGLVGVLGFVVLLAGGLYLLLVPRLRWLVIVPGIVCAVTFWFAYAEVEDPFAAGAPLWTALVVGGGVLAYLADGAARRRGLTERLPRWPRRALPEPESEAVPPEAEAVPKPALR
jgi:hypothetical protein